MSKKNIPFVKLEVAQVRLADGEDVVLEAFQPSIDGLEIIAQHYYKKYNIDIRVSDLSLEDFLSSENEKILQELEEDPNKKIGIILFSLSHTLPIVVSKDRAGREVVIILDSVPSERMSSEVAHHFRDIRFFLNKGIRQHDHVSCVTDSISILKDALRIDDLVSLVESRSVDNNKPSAMMRSRTVAKDLSALTSDWYASCPVDMVKSFTMPEQLLKTAQREEFVKDSNPDLEARLLSNNRLKLREHRAKNSVVIEGGDSVSTYLYTKSARHAEIISETKKDIAEEEKSEAVAVSSTETAQKENFVEKILAMDRDKSVLKPLPHIAATQQKLSTHKPIVKNH